MRKKKKPVNEYIQYSKKITTYTMIVYGIVRVLSIVAVFLRPECGQYMNDIVKGIDSLAVVCISAYTCNSVGEKAITGYFSNKSEEEGAG